MCRPSFYIPKMMKSACKLNAKELYFPRLAFSNISVLSKRFFSAKVEKSSKNTVPSSQASESDLKKRIFNTVLWEKDPPLSFIRKKVIESREKRERLREISDVGVKPMKPVALKYLDDYVESNHSPVESSEGVEDSPPRYPFSKQVSGGSEGILSSTSSSSVKEQATRQQLLQEIERRDKRIKMWMSDYDLFEEDSKQDKNSSTNIYGTSNPNVPTSNVPCGGCGAFLHCQEPSIPGYLPSELFTNRKKSELRSMTCQRCHFLKEFNVALDVCVTPEEYPKIISCIQDKRAIAVIMIDLLDFPCSIWPEIMDIIGSKRPVIIVGNKVDLIPGDHTGYLNHLKETLQIYVEKMGIARANIKHVALISAYTGFGVEDLITRLHDLWEYKSDVFLLGCTNVGKSTLFNQLLQSDFCKSQAIDLIQRATTSIWPGTTLNLLKFPILRPEGWRLAVRNKRLESESRFLQQEANLRKEQFLKQRMYYMPSLTQYVGKSMFGKEIEVKSDVFAMENVKSEQIGIDEKDVDFVKGRWCYDTPGVMHPDQILDILTTEELLKVIPKVPIVPRFFVLRPGKSLLLAGLGRIDLLYASKVKSPRVAVFSSNHLPVTIVQTDEAEDLYNQLLGSELMAVPCGSSQRLADWPGLKANSNVLHVIGKGWKEVCADIVLSSVGWVGVSCGEGMELSFQVWTPHARGIHLRQPALLPYSITFRGKRIEDTPTYHTGRADGELKQK